MTTVISGSSRNKTWDEWVRAKSSRSAKTGKTYQFGVKSLVCFLYGVDSRRGGTDREKVKKLAARYVKEVRANKRNVFDDLASYIQSWKKPSMAIETYMAAVFDFLHNCADVDVDKDARKELRSLYPKGTGEPQGKDGIFTRENLRSVLLGLDLKMRTLVLVLLSSGIRVGEALQLEERDLKLGPDPGDKGDFAATVTVRGETAKEGKRYQSFLSAEAVGCLEMWLHGPRQEFLSSEHYRRASNFKNPAEYLPTIAPSPEAIFPFSYATANEMFNKALKKAGLHIKDGNTNRSQFRIHNLRKFFVSQCEIQGVPAAMVEQWVGHKGYLGGVYQKWPAGQQVYQYHRAESALTVLADNAKVEQLSREKDHRTLENDDLRRRNEQLLTELAEATERMRLWDEFMEKQRRLAEATSVPETELDRREAFEVPEFDMKATTTNGNKGRPA